METKINILASNDLLIGTCQSLKISETRSLEGNTNVSVKIEVPRMCFDRLKLEEVFEKGVFHTNSQKYLMHIVILEDDVETTRATNVWLTGVSTSFKSDDWIIAEGVELECESISSTKSSTLDETIQLLVQPKIL